MTSLNVIFYKAVDVPLEFRIDVHNTLIMPTGVMVMIHEIGTFPHITQTYLLDECALLDLRITRKFHMPMKRSMTRIHDDNDDPSAIMPCQPTRRNYTYINVITRQTRVYAGVWVDCVFEHVQNLVAEFCACLMEQFPVHERFANLPFCKDPNQNISSLHLHNCLHEVYVRIFGEEFASITECYRDFCEHASFSTVISHSRFPAVEARKSHLNWLQTLAGMEVDERAHFAGKSDLARYALRLPASNNFSDASASREEWSLVRAYREGRIDLLNIEFVERNFMLLRVVPASLFMDRVEETEEYPTSRLLSDVGGCVGLWLGASLVTVFELLDLIFDFFELSQWSLARRRFTDSERRRLMAEIEVWRDRALRMEEQQQLNHPSSHIPSNSYEKQVNDNNMVYDGLRKDASFHSFTGLYTDGGMTLMPGVSAALENCLGTAVPADVHTNWLAPWLQANEKPRMSQAIIKDDTLATSLGQVQHQSGSVHQLGMESL
ncbi:unnamed protein product [Protopolystoma xenopodis]|uniref:Uncharacterized protein n=1 Tax=Protopolystoma xenopodis TaxID=117903 RepID=A0A3S5A6L8_9PLAT|nr:unnamed protein product [Protopolystoma xenopodis]